MSSSHGQYEMEVMKAFKNFDQDGDGKISQEEFFAVLHILDPDFTEEHVRLMFDAADLNGDGELDGDEFLTWVLDSGMIQKDDDSEGFFSQLASPEATPRD